MSGFGTRYEQIIIYNKLLQKLEIDPHPFYWRTENGNVIK